MTDTHNSSDWYFRFGYAAGKVPRPTRVDELLIPPLLLEGRAEGCPGVPEYLAKKGMGLTAWTLLPEVLVGIAADLADPTVINSNWACKNTGLDEGAGALIMSWFKQHNS